MCTQKFSIINCVMMFQLAEQSPSPIRKVVVPQKMRMPSRNALFANNYHMMADDFTDEGTRRSIRKHILIKYGRLLPVSHAFAVGGEESSKVLYPLQDHSELHESSFQGVKHTLPVLKRASEKKDQVMLKTNLLVSRDDMPIAHNHSIYTRVCNQLERTEDWEKRLKNMVQALELPQRQFLQDYPKTLRGRQPSQNFGEMVHQRSFRAPQKQSHNISLQPQNKGSLTGELSVLSNDYCKLNGKHIILLKNLYAN